MGVARKRRFLGQKWTPAAAPTPAMQRGQHKVLFFVVPSWWLPKFWVSSEKNYSFAKKMHFWQNSGLLAQKSIFGTALMGMIFFHLTLLWYQNIKTSLCTFFKNVWVMQFFITFRSARKKLHVTVFFDHPVTSSGAYLGQHLGHIVNNGQQSAVLHASVMH